MVIQIIGCNKGAKYVMVDDFIYKKFRVFINTSNF